MQERKIKLQINGAAARAMHFNIPIDLLALPRIVN